MRYASQVTFLMLGLLLALPCAGQSFTRTFLQEPGSAVQQEDPNGQNTTSPPDSANKKTKTPDDAKPTSKGSEKDSGKVPSGKASTANKDTTTTASGTDKKAKPAGQLSFRDLARENLQSLDAAIELAQKAGLEASVAWQDQAMGDPFVAKRKALQERADAAKDEQAWAAVATDSASAVNDLLKTIAANSGSAARSTRPAAEPDGAHRDVPNTRDLPSPVSRSNLALYLAVLSLLVSALALWRGWFLARRETNKALAEAGLI
jgi:hypothetical protein